MYYKGTKEQCEAYNLEVSQGENYQGSTTKWAELQEIEGGFYILKNDKYNSEMEMVDNIQTTTENFIK